LEQQRCAAAGQEDHRGHTACRQTVDERPDAIRVVRFARRRHAVRYSAEAPDVGGSFSSQVGLEQRDPKALERCGQCAVLISG
jgi:hypothetical protein